ncbi:hypothetical protein Rcae01_00216 [Novipirellula caenicola]|uniref:Secreted protein n=1 Tax=Novipirellula caenicola TaxID=1536901 RepID=A0ABP9VHU0_9BACT
MFKSLFISGVLCVMVSVVGCGAEQDRSAEPEVDFQAKVEAYEKAMASDF